MKFLEVKRRHSTWTWVTLAYVAVLLIPIATFSAFCGALETPAMLATYQALVPSAVVNVADLRWNLAFKLSAMTGRHPDIICIGASRAGTLTKDMLAPYHFYNLSFTAWTAKQLADAFDLATRDYQPKTVIVTLDYFMFTEHWIQEYKKRTQITNDPLGYAGLAFGDFLKTWAHQPLLVTTRTLDAPFSYLGSRAQVLLEGFRYDGSTVYSDQHLKDARALQTAHHMLSGYPGESRMLESEKQHIVRLAGLARQRGIKLIAVQLPYIRAGIAYMEEEPSYHDFAGNWRDFETDENRAWLSSLGISFFDLSRLQMDDEQHDFVDSTHLSEQGMRKAVAELMRSPEFRTALPSRPIDR